MTKVIQRNKHYLVKSQYGSYQFNNRKTAEDLNLVLQGYEHTTQQLQKALQQNKKTEEKLDKIQKTIIQLQMTTSILSDELRKLHEEIL